MINDQIKTHGGKNIYLFCRTRQNAMTALIITIQIQHPAVVMIANPTISEQLQSETSEKEDIR